MPSSSDLADVLKNYKSAHTFTPNYDHNPAGAVGFAHQYPPEMLHGTGAQRELSHNFSIRVFAGPGRCRIYVPPGTTTLSFQGYDSEGDGAILPAPYRLYIPAEGLGMEPSDYEIKLGALDSESCSASEMQELVDGGILRPVRSANGLVPVIKTFRFQTYLKKGFWVLVEYACSYNCTYRCTVDFAYYSQEFPKLRLDSSGDPLMSSLAEEGEGGDPGEGGQPNTQLAQYPSLYDYLGGVKGQKGFRAMSVPKDGSSGTYGLGWPEYVKDANTPTVPPPPATFRVYVPEGTVMFGVSGYLAQSLGLPDAEQYTVEVRLHLGAAGVDIEQSDVPTSTAPHTLPNIALLKSGGAQTFVHAGGGGVMTLTGTWIFKTPCRHGFWLLVKYVGGAGPVQEMGYVCEVRGDVYANAFYQLAFDEKGDPLPAAPSKAALVTVPPYNPPVFFSYTSLYQLNNPGRAKGYKSVSHFDLGTYRGPIDTAFKVTHNVKHTVVPGQSPKKIRVYLPRGTTSFTLVARYTQFDATRRLSSKARIYRESDVALLQEDMIATDAVQTRVIVSQMVSAAGQKFTSADITPEHPQAYPMGVWTFKEYLRESFWVLVELEDSFDFIDHIELTCECLLYIFKDTYNALDFDEYGDPYFLNETTYAGSGGGGTVPLPAEIQVDTSYGLVSSKATWNMGDSSIFTVQPKHSYHTLKPLIIEPYGLVTVESLSESRATLVINPAAVTLLTRELTVVKITSGALSCTLNLLLSSPDGGAGAQDSP